MTELNHSQVTLSPILDSQKYHNNSIDTCYSNSCDTELLHRSLSIDSRSYEPSDCSTAGSGDKVENNPQRLAYSTSGGNCLGVPLPQRKYWETILTILGFNLAALTSAVGHYLLFDRLDGTLTDHSLSQSQVSALSLLLGTVFKATLTGSVGICFAQHLWYVLSGSVTPLPIVELMFVLRSNVLALADPRFRSLRRAPLLFLMALFAWTLGVAVIYPPGALTVALEPYSTTINTRVSTMNPPVPDDFNPMMIDEEKQYPTLCRGQRPNTFKGLLPMQIGYTCRGGRSALTNIGKSVITVDQVLDFPSRTGENSTYTLQFRAPQLLCNTTLYNSSTKLDYTAIEGEESGTKKILYTVTGTVFATVYNDSFLDMFSFIRQRIIDYYLPLPFSTSSKTYNASTETEEIRCQPRSMLYIVNVSYPKGIRHLNYQVGDPKIFRYPGDLRNYTNASWPWESNRSDTASYSSDLQSFIHDMTDRLPRYNEFALLHAFMGVMNYKLKEVDRLNYRSIYAMNQSSTGITHMVWKNRFMGVEPQSATSDLAGSVFDSNRFNTTIDRIRVNFNPRTDLNLTQDTLNIALGNFVLSAISLGTWWETVPVTTTRYRTTYKFQPINLVMPYSIALSIATIFTVVGIWSLISNGAPAAEGGFMQVMMATRGDTEMERLVLRTDAMNTDKNGVPQELQDLKVRYGQLVTGRATREGQRRLGFGTFDETISMR